MHFKKISSLVFKMPVIVLTLAVMGYSQNYHMGNTIITEYGTSGLLGGKSGATFGSSSITVGAPVTGQSSSANYGTTFGPWSFYNRQPRPLIFNASKGDYSDQILLTWKSDPLEPPCNDSWKIFRGSLVLVRPTLEDTSYSDRQIMAGQEYNYRIQGTNFYGWGDFSNAIGFVNPNGVITGRILTPHNNPVTAVEVTLTPAYGNALLFDGVDDYVIIPYRNTLNVSACATWEFWVKLNNTGNQRFIGQFTNANQDGYYLNYYNTKIVFSQGNKGSLLQTSSLSNTLTMNTWHHIAVVKDSLHVTIFLDGNNVTATTALHVNMINGNSDLWLGNTNNFTEPLHGILDEVRIWSIALDSSSISRNRSRVVEGNASGLLACWRLDEGFEARAFDLTSHNLDGELVNGPTWSNDHANLHISAFTNMNGNYQISGIYYGSGTTFTVTPSKAGHNQWQPANQNVTLNTSSTSADQINFTDDSMIPVSGYVRFYQTECYVKNVELMNYTAADDTISLSPPIITDQYGHFTIDTEPGSSFTLIPVFKDHTFSPTFIEMTNITEPRNLGIISDTKLRTLNISVVGGRCEFPIGIAEVNIKTKTDCFDTTVTTYSTGKISVNNLPAAEFEVIVNTLNENSPPDDISAGVQVSLIDSNNTVKFIHYEHIQTEVIWPFGTQKVCPNNPDVKFRVINQSDSLDIKITAFQEYGVNRRCYLDSGLVTIINRIADSGAQKQLYITCPDTSEPSVDTMPIYMLIPGVPNILAGGEYPYQKNMTIVVADTAGQDTSVTEWAYVMGHKPRGEFFTTTTPHLPLHILHDPPGDNSYVELDEETELTSTWSFDTEVSGGVKTFAEFKVGIDETIGLGVATELEAQTITKSSWSVDFEVDHGHSWTTTLKTSEEFKTSSGSDIIGAESDVFIGAALNIVYGLTDVLEWDNDNCSVTMDTTITMAPRDFETFYLYTEDHIRNTVIPQLRYEIQDTNSAALWEQILEMNEHNKANAEMIKNISFTSGAGYSSTEEVTTSHQWKLNGKLTVNRSIAESISAEASGSGSEIGTEINFGITVGGGYEHSYSHTTTTKYELDDDDTGDYFTIDVLKDGVYGTPVFKLKAGASSCPWEPGTASREGVQLQMDSYEATNIARDGSAIFTLYLGNTSQTGEQSTYLVRAIPESNPYGAILQIDGQTIAGSAIPVDIPAGEQKEMILTVKRGPYTNRYQDLQIMLCSSCAYAIPSDSVVLADTATFNVIFEELCESDIEISYPKDDWLVNQDDKDVLHLTVAGYDKNDPNFAAVYFEYAHDQGSLYGAQWFIADTISLDTIQAVTTNYMPWIWDVSTVDNGPYWIRVKSECNDGSFTYSDALHGLIDRDYPTIYGTPQPVDGVLGPDDEISITFTKPLNCYKIYPDDIQLFDITRNDDVLVQYPISCNGYTITIVPDEQNYFLENNRLRATIHNIETAQGENLLRPVSWEFVVDRNPVHWNQPELDTTYSVETGLVLETILRNTGTESAEFSFSGAPWWMSTPHGPAALPWWMKISPSYGILEPGGEAVIRFTISDMLNIGKHSETIYAHTPEGDEPLTISIRTLQTPPVWSLDKNDYQYTMSLIAQISVRDTSSNDVYDMVGAFFGQECRGFTNLFNIFKTANGDTLDSYEAFLTVYSNVSTGEQISFRIWDASAAEEYWEIEQHLDFVNNAVIGSAENPLRLNATGAVAQFIELNEGWTWFSVNLTYSNENMNINNALSMDNFFKNGDRIIHQNTFESFSESTGQWLPGLMVLDPETMYKAHLDTFAAVTVVGNEINPDSLSITILPNWNWLGYPLRDIARINDALINLSVSDHAIIKNKYSFAEYVTDLGQWVGSLQWMEPGQGYLFKSTSNDTLTFTYSGMQINSGVLAITVTNRSSLSQPIETPWRMDCGRFAYNMPLIAELDDDVLLTEQVALAAMSANEVRGITVPEFSPVLEKWQLYLMIYSNTTEGDNISFELFDTQSSEIYGTNITIEFNHHNIAGSVMEPILLTKTEPEAIPNTYMMAQNYPNPFNPATVITFGLPRESRVDLTVYDVLGRKVKTLISKICKPGYHTITWDGTDNLGQSLATGIYFVRMESGRFVAVRKTLHLK